MKCLHAQSGTSYLQTRTHNFRSPKRFHMHFLSAFKEMFCSIRTNDPPSRFVLLYQSSMKEFRKKSVVTLPSFLVASSRLSCKVHKYVFLKNFVKISNQLIHQLVNNLTTYINLISDRRQLNRQVTPQESYRHFIVILKRDTRN